MKDLITVVIPVYNTDKYLSKCLDSVLGQSYSQLEIIIVDDGSSDSSPEICDAYAAKDTRVRVIHQQNGGLSRARNAAIRIASGKYITFVDSDDYIEEDMLAFLHFNQTSNDCDISTCGFEYVYENTGRKTTDQIDQLLVLDTDEALSDILYNTHSTLHACGKLFKTSLFKDIRFPEGKIYEDAGTTYKLISKSKGVCIGTAKKYNYLQRQQSITSSPFSRNTLDSLHFAHEILAYVQKLHPTAVPAAESYMFATACTMIYLIVSSGQHKEYQEELDSCKSIVTQYCKSVSRDSKASTRSQIYARVARLHAKALSGLLYALHIKVLIYSVWYSVLQNKLGLKYE